MSSVTIETVKTFRSRRWVPEGERGLVCGAPLFTVAPVVHVASLVLQSGPQIVTFEAPNFKYGDPNLPVYILVSTTQTELFIHRMLSVDDWILLGTTGGDLVESFNSETFIR